MNTNSFISLCLSVWMVFFIPLSPHSLQKPVIFVFCFFHYSSCCFLPPAFISALASLYFFFLLLLQLFLPTSVSFSLFIIPSWFSLLSVIFISYRLRFLLPPQQNKVDNVSRDESGTKVKYHYPSDCHLDVLEILFFFFFFRLIEKALGCQYFHKHTMHGLILHNFCFIHLKQA